MKTFIAGRAAAALLATWSMPAEASYHWHQRHHDDAGDVVAGALVIGGIAALASSITRGKRQKQDYAVRSCSGEAESRTGGHVLEIGHVAKAKGYYTVEGLLDGGREAARQTFACTVRGSAIYSFRAAPLTA